LEDNDDESTAQNKDDTQNVDQETHENGKQTIIQHL
jgi:hypothetical protein